MGEDLGTLALIVGISVGLFGPLWTLWKAFRDRERVYVAFYVIQEYVEGQDDRTVAMVDVANVGTYPAHVVGMNVVDELSWVRRWPFRLIGHRTRHRRLFRWLLGRAKLLVYTPLPGFHPQQVPARSLIDVREDGDAAQIEEWIQKRCWVLVDTALRFYVARIREHRGTEAERQAAWVRHTGR